MDIDNKKMLIKRLTKILLLALLLVFPFSILIVNAINYIPKISYEKLVKMAEQKDIETLVWIVDAKNEARFVGNASQILGKMIEIVDINYGSDINLIKDKLFIYKRTDYNKPKYAIGLETICMALLLPVGFIFLSFWILDKNKIPFISEITVLFMTWLVCRGFLSPFGVGWFELMRLGCMFGIAFYVSANEKITIGNVVKVISITALLELLFVFPEYFTLVKWVNTQAQEGIRGSMGTDNKLSMFLLVCFPCGFHLLLNNGCSKKLFNQIFWQIVGFACIVVSCVLIILSKSRAGIGLCIAEIIIYSLLVVRAIPSKRDDLVKDKFKSIYGFLIAFIIIGFALFAVNRSGDELVKVSDMSQINLLYGQKPFVEYTKEIIKTFPFIGSGVGTWREASLTMGLEGVWGHPHNELGQCWAEYGLIGLVPYIIIICMILYCGMAEFTALMVLVPMLIHSFVAGMRTPEQTLYFGVFAGFAIQRLNMFLTNKEKFSTQ